MIRSLFVLFVMTLLVGCGAVCDNEISHSIASPSGAMKAVVFNRACGATVGFNNQVSILPSNEDLPNDGGNVLIIDDSDALEITWESDIALKISSVTSARVVKQETSVGNVRISYAQ